ncbi:MAG: TonB-dependent receptor [Bacteroidota bacterium]
MPRFFLAFFIWFFPVTLIAQLDLSCEFKETPLSEVLSQLQEDHLLVFSYTEGTISPQNITVSFSKKTLEEALALIFASTDLAFEIIDDTFIVIKPKPIELFHLCGWIVGPDGENLPLANIRSLLTGNGITANEIGKFDWHDKISGSDLVEVSYIGFEPMTLPASFFSSCPTLALKPLAFSFSEVVVKEYITTGIEQSPELDHIVLRPERMSVVPGLTEADVLQMVQILPGVESLDESASGLYIRGGTPDQNLILWDGIPVYNSGHFFGMISAFNPYIVDNIKVFRSGYGAEYGGRVSSVIDINSTQEIPERVKIDAGINFTHADLSIELPLLKKKSVLLLSGRRAYTDIIESPTYKKLSQRVFQKGKINDAQNEAEEDEDFSLDFQFSDLNAKWLVEPGDKDRIQFSAFRITDNLNFFFENADDEFRVSDNLNLNDIGLSAEWEHRWQDDFHSIAKVAYSNMDNDYLFAIQEQDSSGLELSFRQTNDVRDLNFHLDNRYAFSDASKLDFGYHVSALKVKRLFASEDDNSSELIDENTIHSAYLTFNQRIKKKLSIKPGLRLSYGVSNEQFNIEPRILIHYFPKKHWQFKASAGLYHQFLGQVIELNELGLNQQLWVLADSEEEIPVSRSEHYSIGLVFHPTDFQFEIEGYYKRLSGLTSFSPIFINNFQEDDYSEGTGNAYGIDLLLKKKWHKYQAWLSYSYSRVFYKFDIYSNNNPFPAPHDRPHSFTTIHQLKLKNWDLSLSWKFASGKTYTEANGFFVDENEDALPDYDYENTNESRLPAYHRLDASVLYKIIPKSGKFQAKIGMSVLNIYNRQNILSREYLVFYEDEIQDFQIESLDRQMLRFTPNVVVRFSY